MLLVGRVTRLAPYMEGEPKVYEATIAFGNETDTDDVTGTPTVAAERPSRDAVERAMTLLTGSIEQVPPAYSAKQVGGVRAYAAARRGAPLELRSARVHVHGWDVRAWRDTAEVDVTITCGSGTYIRALARDLGRLSGSAAHLAALRRTRSGPYDVRDALPAQALDGSAPLRSPREALSALETVAVDDGDRQRISRGQTIPARDTSSIGGTAARGVLVDDAGAIVAIAEREGSVWAPKVVLTDA